MPVYTPTRLGQAQPGVAFSNLYVVPAAKSAIVKGLVVCNVTGGSIALDVSLVASGGTAGDTNAVIRNHIIQPWATVMYTLDQVLATGGFVAMKASAASSLTLTLSGVEIT
jgi:hypothetical protein